MITSGPLQKIFAIVLLFAIVAMRLSSVSYVEFVVPVQDVIAKVAVILDGDYKPQTAHYKVKGQGLDLPVPCADFVLAENLQVSRLVYSPPPELALPEGHTRIFIPPA
ncbi:hypothetical protein [Trichloromonas sp.]|uniref:hypothetical protein n=1 Tax=Trichloromonas sp. TaxID=3069249 RepID=UPI002A3F4F0B|nr:hypothetical protein [Trichloromonas sp.]